jgi:hypothetical protein
VDKIRLLVVVVHLNGVLPVAALPEAAFKVHTVVLLCARLRVAVRYFGGRAYAGANVNPRCQDRAGTRLRAAATRLRARRPAAPYFRIAVALATMRATRLIILHVAKRASGAALAFTRALRAESARVARRARGSSCGLRRVAELARCALRARHMAMQARAGLAIFAGCARAARTRC